MGRFDNYSNRKTIESMEKKIVKMECKRKPDLYGIEVAKADLEKLKLFESCQIFGNKTFGFSAFDPNLNVMFSDDNRVIWFGGRVIPYDELASYSMLENRVATAHTETKRKGTISRAIVGGAIAGGVGAVIGGATAGSRSTTTYQETGEGFVLRVHLKNGEGYQIDVPNTGGLSNKYSRRWGALMSKLQMIIDENKAAVE